MPDLKFPHRWLVAIRGGEEHIEITVDEQKRVGMWIDGAIRIMTSDEAKRLGWIMVDAGMTAEPKLAGIPVEMSGKIVVDARELQGVMNRLSDHTAQLIAKWVESTGNGSGLAERIRQGAWKP